MSELASVHALREELLASRAATAAHSLAAADAPLLLDASPCDEPLPAAYAARVLAAASHRA